MTDEQAWEDLSRFALAMKRGATVAFNNGLDRPCSASDGRRIDYVIVREYLGIREIIEPPQKKVRPLNAEEWRDVAGCIIWDAAGYSYRPVAVPLIFECQLAELFAERRYICAPTGDSKDIRKLWVEE